MDQRNFSSYQKLTIWLFIIVGTATIIFGVLHLRKAISLPFARTGSGGFKTADEQEKERMEKLKSQDTDGDGLKDYDELYVFRTSPFLEDTDSDSIFDGKELADSTDPNCPQGKTCRQTRVDTAATTDSTTTSTQAEAGQTAPDGDKIVAAISETFGDINALTPAKISEKLATMSSSDLRAFLVKLGIPAKALDKADDATLRKLLQESLEEIAGSAAPAPAAGASGEGSAATNAPAPTNEPVSTTP